MKSPRVLKLVAGRVLLQLLITTSKLVSRRVEVASRSMKALVMSPNMYMATGNAPPCRKAAAEPSRMRSRSRHVA